MKAWKWIKHPERCVVSKRGVSFESTLWFACTVLCVLTYNMNYKIGRAGRDEDTDGNMSGKGSLTEEEEEEEEEDDEEEDVSVLSSLDDYQICLKYQQVFLRLLN